VRDWVGSRRRLLQLAVIGAAGALAPRALAAHLFRWPPLIANVRIHSRRPYAGDTPELVNLGMSEGRDTGLVTFDLSAPADIALDVRVTGQGAQSEQPSPGAEMSFSSQQLTLPAGKHTVQWAPDPALIPPRTYILHLRATPAGRPNAGPDTGNVVARFLGIDASLGVRTTLAGATLPMTIRTDATQLTLQALHCGVETDPTYSNDVINGDPVGDPVTVDWSRHMDGPATVPVQIGDWPAGLYAFRIDSDDKRVGFVPIVVRPPAPKNKVAVVLPTSTWHAYNFYDADGDGWGDTWYARWKTLKSDMTRPHANRGVPYRYRSYDLQFLQWLVQTNKDVDYYGDEDLERFTPEALREAYELLVFSGHTEYVTKTLYDVVTAYRNRGGNLAFLSANNFFRRVERRGEVLKLIDEWRDLHRPEAALCGVQYLASDRGGRQQPFLVVGADAAPWAFKDTGLSNGTGFGLYGIEIDARARTSPPNVEVLAVITNLFGKGRTAEMTYYEHPSGAKVFSAGVLNFGGQVLLWPESSQLLQNVWDRLAPGTAGPPAGPPPVFTPPPAD